LAGLTLADKPDANKRGEIRTADDQLTTLESGFDQDTPNGM